MNVIRNIEHGIDSCYIQKVNFHIKKNIWMNLTSNIIEKNDLIIWMNLTSNIIEKNDLIIWMNLTSNIIEKNDLIVTVELHSEGFIPPDPPSYFWR